MRFWLYVHVAAMICCGLFSIADRYGMLVDTSSPWVAFGVAAALYPSLIALFVCPFAVFLLLVTGSRAFGQIVTIVAAEVVLTLGQLLVLAPGVSTY